MRMVSGHVEHVSVNCVKCESVTGVKCESVTGVEWKE